MALLSKKQPHTRRGGAAATELAILLPFLALVFSAAVDFGRIFNATQTLNSAASTGAMYASGTLWVPTAQTTTTSAAITAACAEASTLNPPLTASQVSVTITGGVATVTVSYNYPLLTSVLVPQGTVSLQRTVSVNVAPVVGN